MAGFTGSFSASNWTLNGDPPPYQACDGYYGTAGSLGCAEITNDIDGFAFIGGAQAPTQETTTTWSWLNTTGSDYYVSFSYDFSAITLSTQYATIQVGTSFSANSNTLPSYFVDNKLVKDGESITFSVIVPTTKSAAGLDISGFNAQVPAPLPATGAAAAFGYSRRLRRRIKGIPGSSSRRQSRTPAHPAAYLNLAPAALQSLPLSFHYSGSSTARLHGALRLASSVGPGSPTTTSEPQADLNAA